jgi:hypothetical protein
MINFSTTNKILNTAHHQIFNNILMTKVIDLTQ